jgi:hypothetical protein
MRFTRGLLALAASAMSIGPLAWGQQTTGGSGRYAATASPAVRGGQADPSLSVSLRDTETGEIRRFTIPTADPDLTENAIRQNMYQVEAVVVSERRAVVKETLKFGEALSVLDLPGGQLVDRLTGYRFAFSPDRARAVYLYHYPPRAEYDEVVLVYDFTGSPAQNSMLPFSVKPAERGVILYPPENRANARFLSVSDPLVKVTSPFAWCGNDRVAFLVTRGGETSLLTMTLPPKLADARLSSRQPVDPRLFLRPEYRDALPQEYTKSFVVAKGLSFGENCASLSVVPFPFGPFEEKPVVIHVEDSSAR